MSNVTDDLFGVGVLLGVGDVVEVEFLGAGEVGVGLEGFGGGGRLKEV